VVPPVKSKPKFMPFVKNDTNDAKINKVEMVIAALRNDINLSVPLNVNICI
jgi:hypothetical protein